MNEPRPYQPSLIGIAGGTGSGKTTIAHKIVEQLPAGEADLIQHDWYYRDNAHLSLERRAQVNYDEPSALENELFVAQLQRLRSGHSVDCPQYDFTQHTRAATKRPVEPHRIIVVEGILLFAVPEVRELFDLRLYVDTDDDIRLMRRIKRDIIHRGRDIRAIQHQYYETVRPMHRMWVAPSKQYAHLIIPEGGENREAVEVIVGRLLYLLSGVQAPPTR